MSSFLKKKTVSGVLWRLAVRIGTQAINFIVGIILARLLGPKAYGTVAMLLIFVNISETLVNCGFNVALVQKKEVSESDWSSVFYLQCSISLVLYCCLWFASPYIAGFYHMPELANVLRVQALILPIHAVQGIQTATIERDLRFKLTFAIGMAGTIVGAIVGIGLAYMGFGYWALVYATLLNGFVAMLVACLFVRRIPRFMFSMTSLREMFRFGGKMLASDFAGSIMGNITGIVIGRAYSPQDLACYERGKQLPNVIMDTFNSPLTTVSFPVLSKLQDDKVRLREGMRQILMGSTFFIMPAMAVLSAVSETVIWLLLGDKWLQSVPFCQIACLSCAFTPFATVSLQATKAIGRSGSYLGITIAKGLVTLFVLALFYRYSVLALAAAFVLISTPISMILNSWTIGKYVNYPILKQVNDVLPMMAISIALSVILWSLRFLLPVLSMFTLCIQLGLGFVLFYCAFLMFRPNALKIVLDGVPVLRKFFPDVVLTCK